MAKTFISQKCCKLIRNLFITIIITNSKRRNQSVPVEKGLGSNLYELSVSLEWPWGLLGTRPPAHSPLPGFRCPQVRNPWCRQNTVPCIPRHRHRVVWSDSGCGCFTFIELGTEIYVCLFVCFSLSLFLCYFMTLSSSGLVFWHLSRLWNTRW